MRLRAAAAAALVLLLAVASPARAGDLTAEEQRWVKDLVASLAANSPRVRKAAEDALASMGLDALPTIAETLPTVKGEAAARGLRRALETMGRADVLAALARLGQATSNRAAAKRYEDLAAVLGGGPQSAAGGVPASMPLVAGRLEDPSLAPLALEGEVRGRLPPSMTSRVVTAAAEEALLRIDLDGDGQTETAVPRTGPRVVEVAGRAGARAVLLVYAKAERWFACPASVLRGGAGSNAVELLDGDGDGAFDGAQDYVRAGDGAFGRVASPRRFAFEEGVAQWRVVDEGGAKRLALEPEPRPQGVGDDAIAGLAALDRWRRTVGLPPARLDASRCAACAAHARYMQMNDGTPEMEGLGAHAEHEGRPGYTPQGAAAAGSSVLSHSPDPARAVASWSATMLHGTDLLGPSDWGYGIASAGGRGGGTVLWGADPVVSGGVPFVVPAPGQRRVPTRGGAEEPPPEKPANWYASPRGFPVSVFTAGMGVTGVEVRLFSSDGRTPVAGQAWNAETPIRANYGGGAAFFMPVAPLDPKATYVATATATGPSGPVSWMWSFRTD